MMNSKGKKKGPPPKRGPKAQRMMCGGKPHGKKKRK